MHKSRLQTSKATLVGHTIFFITRHDKVSHAYFRLTHFLFIYEQIMFNFSNIQLEQWIHFPCNPFFIQPAIMTFLSSFNQPKQKPSISKLQLWLLDTFNTKKIQPSSVVLFISKYLSTLTLLFHTQLFGHLFSTCYTFNGVSI